MARGSIRQYFPILSTTPINAAPAPPNSHVPTDPQHSIITTRQSGDSGSSRSQFRARQPLLLQDTSSQAVGTRVDAASPGASRAVCPQTAKDGEFLPAQAYERVRKRALKKALNKAATSGHSLYRGKTLYANVSVFPKTPAVTPSVTGPRVKVFSWNCDGLTTTLYSELLCWLRKHSDISVVMLQETHWSRSMEWTSEDWHFCHSASLKANTAGVLIGVRATLARTDTISWRELLPGRLMQMRCYCNQQHMDLVCAYQHAMGFGDATKLQSIYSKRRSFWRELDALMHSLPYRSHVIVGGDMNCSVEPFSRLVGFGVLHGPNTDSAKADRQHFMQIVKSHQLCILNSWGPKVATYRHPKGRSQMQLLRHVGLWKPCWQGGDPPAIHLWWLICARSGSHGNCAVLSRTV